MLDLGEHQAQPQGAEQWQDAALELMATQVRAANGLSSCQ